METRELASIEVTAVGLGCNNFARKLDFETSRDVVGAALESGINFFDTADRYGYGDHAYSGVGRSEEFLGRALGSMRPQVVIATKFGQPMDEQDPARSGAGERWIRQACEDSLRRLGTDYIDLYQLHFPDAAVPIAETLGALGALVEQGHVRAVGCSNFTAGQLRDADDTARDLGVEGFVSVQNEYSLLVREAEADVLPLCDERGIAFLPYFPLASGLLTGKYREGQPAPPDSRLTSWQPRPHLTLSGDVLGKVERLARAAAVEGRELLDLAFAWLLTRPAVRSVIAGATSTAQVRRNAGAVTTPPLTDEELRLIDEITGTDATGGSGVD